MKLGIGSYAYAWAAGVPGYGVTEPLTARGLVEKAADLGVSLVQIADNIPFAKYPRAELEVVRQTAQELGVEIELGLRGGTRENFVRHIDLCQFFGSKILRVVVETENDRPSVAEVVDRIAFIEPELRTAGITLAIENHDRFDSATFAKLVAEVNSESVAICLDTVNSFGALEGPDVVVRTLAPYVGSLHVKDFVIHRASHSMGFEITGAPAGQGRLDIPSLLNTLRQHGREPNAILELWPKPEANIADTIAKEERWVKESVQYLRTLIPHKTL